MKTYSILLDKPSHPLFFENKKDQNSLCMNLSAMMMIAYCNLGLDWCIDMIKLQIDMWIFQNSVLLKKCVHLQLITVIGNRFQNIYVIFQSDYVSVS